MSLVKIKAIGSTIASAVNRENIPHACGRGGCTLKVSGVDYHEDGSNVDMRFRLHPDCNNNSKVNYPTLMSIIANAAIDKDAKRSILRKIEEQIVS